MKWFSLPLPVKLAKRAPLSTSLPFSGRKGAGCGDNPSNGFSIVAYSLPPRCTQPLWRESAMPLTALVPLELRQVQLGANGLLSPLHVRPRALDLAKLPGANHLRRKHTLLSTKSASYAAKKTLDIQRSPSFCANTFKKDLGRARQNSSSYSRNKHHQTWSAE